MKTHSVKIHFQPGKYKCKIASWSVGKSKKKGTPCVEFFVDILEDAKGNSVESNRQRSVTLWITEGTIGRVVDELHALGYDRESFDALEPLHSNAFDFTGVEVICECEHEDYIKDDGSTVQTERWKFHNTNQSFIEPIDNAVMRGLNAQFGKLLKSKPNGNQQAKPTPQRQSADADVI